MKVRTTARSADQAIRRGPKPFIVAVATYPFSLWQWPLTPLHYGSGHLSGNRYRGMSGLVGSFLHPPAPQICQGAQDPPWVAADPAAVIYRTSFLVAPTICQRALPKRIPSILHNTCCKRHAPGVTHPCPT